MTIKFVDRANVHIDKLVEISWERRTSHANEILLMRSQAEAELMATINDEMDDVDIFEGPIPINLSQASQRQRFETNLNPIPHKIIVAVDTGLAHLGEFIGGGIAFAIRGAAYCLINKNIYILRYNTGPLLVDNHNMLPMFYYIGKRLGNETLYVGKSNTGQYVLRESVLQNTNQIQDRCRNFVERMIQEEVIGIMMANQRGLLLIDGALSGGTFDTPASYLHSMLDNTVSHRIDVAAISKKTRITIKGKPLSALFDEQAAFIGYMPLKEIIENERQELVHQGIARGVEAITMGNELFAARFGLGPPALTFRVDIKNSKSTTEKEVIDSVFSDCQIHGCYPKPLIEVHQHSSFLYQDVQQLLADLIVRTGARPKERQSMDWLFAPIGGFGK